RRARQVGRLVNLVAPQVQPEEIAHRDFEARFGVAFPVAAQHQFLQMVAAARRDREPDVRNHARAGRLEPLPDTARGNRPTVAVAAGRVVTGLLQALVAMRPRVRRKESSYDTTGGNSDRW